MFQSAAMRIISSKPYVLLNHEDGILERRSARKSFFKIVALLSKHDFFGSNCLDTGSGMPVVSADESPARNLLHLGNHPHPAARSYMSFDLGVQPTFISDAPKS